MKVDIIKFPTHGDDRGQLIALEGNKEIPFEIKRVYYIYDTPTGVRRGFHAHKKLKQVLVCVSGACTIHLDNGEETAEVVLDKPTEGLLIDSLMWREMYSFSPNAVLMVFASERYDEADYIRDHDKFIEYFKEMHK